MRTTNRLGSWRNYRWLVILLLALVAGGAARARALYDWDGVAMLHPDERFVVYAAWHMAVPATVGDYLGAGCHASTGADCASLNPRDQAWSRIFVYGTLPTTVMRVTSTLLYGAAATPLQVRNVGRTGAFLADMCAIGLVFVVGIALLRREWAAAAALCYALFPLPIQLSHFATVDAYASPLLLGALALRVR